MNIHTITPSDEMWESLKNYAENCSWRAGKALAYHMDNNGFSDWERVIALSDNANICGFCTVSKTDCIPNVAYTPYIGYLFVGENYRGNRLSGKLIQCAMEYLKSVGFNRVYLVSDHINLYERYGFHIIDRKMAPWGTEEKIYMKEIN
ncbi:MAG: GNAT family N-acetyltransferase [Lachnospiraceae bacterium]|nr:GNAT family N-acetyltransferase [Lachnospiraceae bacterium]